ncbi:MAG: hypothetical protein ACLUHA_12055 [Bacteroides stercoris]
MTGGAGVELRTKAGNFLVEGRYYYALSDFWQQYQEGLLFPFGTRSHHRQNHLFVRFKEIKKITV